MTHFYNLERVGAVQKTIPEEFKRYDLFKKSKAKVAKPNALNLEPISGITSMIDISQVVYDRLSDETLENDGEALFEKISSYGRSFIAVGEEPSLHLVFYQRDVPIDCGHPGNFPVDVVSKSFPMDTLRGCSRH